jgi:hypothetical protein
VVLPHFHLNSNDPHEVEKEGEEKDNLNSLCEL